MGFARLHYNNSGSTVTIGNIAKDIVGVITGDYTNVNQLEYATQNLSLIYNSAGRGNWTRVFPSTSSATVPQVLSSTCLNGTTKYIRLTSQGSSDAVGNPDSGDFYGYQAVASVQGLILHSCLGATNASTVTGASFVQKSSTAANIQHHNMITGNYIWLSWSSRHCAMIGNTQGSGNTLIGLSGSFEFNETGIFDYRNLAPFVHLQLFDNSFDTTNLITPAVSAAANLSSIIVMNHFRPDTGVANDTLNLTANLAANTQHTISTNNVVAYPQAFTKSSGGLNTIYLQPMFWHQHQMGVPHQYISDLCKIYRTQPGIGVAGDLLTVGSDTYVYFPLQNSTYAVAVLRA